jgi:hypothetical protein
MNIMWKDKSLFSKRMGFFVYPIRMGEYPKATNRFGRESRDGEAIRA